MVKTERGVNIDWNNEIVERGFKQEVGQCFVMDADIEHPDGSEMQMRLNICRKSEDELTMTGAMEFDREGLTQINSTYKKNQPMPKED